MKTVKREDSETRSHSNVRDEMEPKRSLGAETASARVLWDAKIKKTVPASESPLTLVTKNQSHYISVQILM